MESIFHTLSTIRVKASRSPSCIARNCNIEDVYKRQEYYRAMATVIEERFVNWQGQDYDEDTLEPSDVAQAIMEYLDCECTYFPSMKDDDPIMAAYSYAKRDSSHEGFIPVLIKPEESLLELSLIHISIRERDW